ncbi:MFS transporter [Bacillus sp. DNRA2]|uniref:MFS transporter n=1 Tax=Bacillus sp. DNRA2 TaxID=2723053 RepID=UPI00145DAD2E|nr:MFS transporter [Bacillus sp. DNRA2]NMD69210.1 MFS transporter [Bacillus sp. DNRA2]
MNGNPRNYQAFTISNGMFAKKAARNAFIVAVVLFLSIYIGSEAFSHLDMALYGYLWASILSFLLLTVRITAWTLRPPTRRLWQQGRRMFSKKAGWKFMFGALGKNIGAQKFISKRSTYRWLQHMLISWGVLLSFAITFSLVFSWLHFELVDVRTYQVVVFGIPTFRMPVDSILAFLIYHGLNWTGIAVIIGSGMAMYRRYFEEKKLVEQAKEYDFFPLILLIVISVTGSLLTFSTYVMEGRFYTGISLSHQMAVIIFLLYFPFGKFWHIPLRFLAIVIPAYHALENQKKCSRCGIEYATETQIEDIQLALNKRSLSVPIEQTDLHMSDLCSECRRVTNRLAAFGTPVHFGQAGIHVSSNGQNGLVLHKQGGVDNGSSTKR